MSWISSAFRIRAGNDSHHGSDTRSSGSNLPNQQGQGRWLPQELLLLDYWPAVQGAELETQMKYNRHLGLGLGVQGTELPLGVLAPPCHLPTLGSSTCTHFLFTLSLFAMCSFLQDLLGPLLCSSTTESLSLDVLLTAGSGVCTFSVFHVCPESRLCSNQFPLKGGDCNLLKERLRHWILGHCALGTEVPRLLVHRKYRLSVCRAGMEQGQLTVQASAPAFSFLSETVRLSRPELVHSLANNHHAPFRLKAHRPPFL